MEIGSQIDPVELNNDFLSRLLANFSRLLAFAMVRFRLPEQGTLDRDSQ
jgi:hypothetical protein